MMKRMVLFPAMALLILSTACLQAQPKIVTITQTEGPYRIYPMMGGLSSETAGPEWNSGPNLLFIAGADNFDLTNWKFETANCSHALKLKDASGKVVGLHMNLHGVAYGFVRCRYFDNDGNQLSLYLIAYDQPRPVRGTVPTAASEAADLKEKKARWKKLLTEDDEKELLKFGTQEQKDWLKSIKK